jgi:phosphoserine phosphatase
LRIEDFLATTYTTDPVGNFSAIDQIVLGESKVDALRKLAKKHAPCTITAYSDSYHDLPFLLAADYPIAVRPDRALRRFCKKNDWAIIQ